MTDTAIAAAQDGAVTPGSPVNLNPLAAAERIGEWLHQTGMCASPGAGKLLAFTALSRGVDVVQFVGEHAIVDGRIRREADAPENSSPAASPAASKTASNLVADRNAGALATNAQLDRIVTLGGRITNSDTGLSYTVGEIASQIHDIYGCEPNALSAEHADELISRFEAILTQKSPTAA